MTKKDFIIKISTMVNPSIKEISCGMGDLPEYCWVIEDVNDFRNKFCTPSVRLSRTEYLSRRFDSFENRLKSTGDKYQKWINEYINRELK